MNILPQDFVSAKERLENATQVVIISHKHPDGDTLGANLALRLHLKSLGKEVTSVCIDSVPEVATFLPEIKSFVQDFSVNNGTTYVAVDCGAKYMTKFDETKPEIFSGNFPLINIDHHASNEGYGTINLVDADSAAAVQIVYRLFKFSAWPITRDIATCLMNGLYFDTGSFMHSNVTPEVYNMAAHLMRLGADFKTIVKKQFQTNSIPKLHLLGRALSRISLNDKKIVASHITEKDFEECSADADDLTGAIDYLNSIPSSKFSILISEDFKGNVKGSLRARDDIDLSRVAGILGGGGHKKASGFAIPGRIIEKLVVDKSRSDTITKTPVTLNIADKERQLT